MLKVLMILGLLVQFTFGDGSVLKTGQDKSYDGGGNMVTDGSIKDDGYYQTGKARSYGHSGDIVIDNATGLQWQDDESIEKKWEDSGSYPAEEYCNTLPLRDHADWRLPSVRELLSLVDVSQYDPSATEGIFSHIFSSGYWSTTTYVNTTSYAWLVYFHEGRSDRYTKTFNHYVRCVRGGQLEPSNFSRNDETDIVTDTTTGLQWQDDDAARTMFVSWTTAIDYCENILALGGYSDWRLPNRNELLSIVDYSQYDPAIYSVFVNRSSYYYWSSTTYVNNTSSARTVDFYRGNSSIDPKTSDDFVRCVRGGQVDTSAFLPPVIMYLLD